MKKYFRFWSAGLVLLVLGFLFAGCASLPVSEVDPFKGTTWGIESAQGLNAFIKFKDDGTVLAFNKAPAYTVYKTSSGYEVRFSASGLNYFFRYDSSKPDEAVLACRAGAAASIGTFGMTAAKDLDSWYLKKMN